MRKTIWMLILTICTSTQCMNAFAEWQCFSRDRGGHMWESPGSTEERATAVALSFCKGYSPDSESCQMSKCVSK